MSSAQMEMVARSLGVRLVGFEKKIEEDLRGP